MRAVISFSLLLLLLSACHPSSLPAEEYVAWVEQKMRRVKDVGDYTFDVQALPFAYQCVKSNPKLNVSQFEALKRQMGADTLLMYEVTIGSFDIKKQLPTVWEAQGVNLSEIGEYFAYRLQDEVYLEANGTKYPCTAYHFEESYTNQSGQFRIMVGFGEAPVRSQLLVINSRLFQTGPVKIDFNITNMPSLALDE